MRPAPLAEPSLDTICVDRSILPLYPNWVKMVMHPDLEATGPAKYGLATVEPWLHDGQKNGGRMVGNRIYEHLRAIAARSRAFISESTPALPIPRSSPACRGCS